MEMRSFKDFLKIRKRTIKRDFNTKYDNFQLMTYPYLLHHSHNINTHNDRFIKYIAIKIQEMDGEHTYITGQDSKYIDPLLLNIPFPFKKRK